jgi:hypothetical protein
MSQIELIKIATLLADEIDLEEDQIEPTITFEDLN